MRALFTTAAMLVPCLVAAQTPEEHPGWALLQGAYVSQQNSSCIKKAPAVGVGVGQWLTPAWGWEASLLDASIKDTAGLWKARETHLDGSALYSPFGQLGSWRPFLRGGLGATNMEAPLSLSASSTTRLNLLGGLGTQYVFKEHGLASVEARAASVRTSDPRTELQLLLGVGIRWGGGGAKRASAPVSAPVPPPSAAPEPTPVPAPIQEPAPPVPAPAPVVAAASEATPEAPVQPTLSEGVLHFGNNRADLTPGAQAALETLAGHFKVFTGAFTLSVDGYASSTGSRAHNLELSRRRARATAKALVALGVPAAKVHAKGHGVEMPVASNATREGQALNRRVEIGVQTADPQLPRTRLDTKPVD